MLLIFTVLRLRADKKHRHSAQDAMHCFEEEKNMMIQGLAHR